jgi:flagellar hook-length control protein FliK
MTLMSVGSTGASAGPPGSQTSASGNDTPPAGFEELLTGANPRRDPSTESTGSARHDRDTEPCEQSDPHKAAADQADDADRADATNAATDNANDGAPAKPDGADDKTGMVAALALTTPITHATTVPATDAAASASANGADAVADATVPVVDPGVADAAPAPPAPQVVDLAAVLANLPTADPPATPDPVLLPLPDLPTASAARTHVDSPAATTTNAARESFAVPPAPAEHARPTVSAPPATGAATFAPAPPPPPAPPAAAVASVTAEDGTAARVTPPPSEQLVSVLTPLRTNQNGSYTLRLELKPPELGRVEMRVEMRDGVLHASIHAEHHNAAQTLRDALGDLRDRLGSEGVPTGDLSVSDGGVGARQDASGSAAESRARLDAGPAGDTATVADTAPTHAPISSPDTTSLLDVRV